MIESIKNKWHNTKNFVENVNEELSDRIAERLVKSGNTNPSLWDGYKAFFSESFEVSNKSVFDPAKKPIKDAAKKLDKEVQEKLNNGNSQKMTAAKKAWNGFKGAGKMVDEMVSAEGFVIAGSAYLAGGAVLGKIAQKAPIAVDKSGKVINKTIKAAGGACSTAGAYKTATAKNEQEAQSGGKLVATGAMLLTPAAKDGVKKLTGNLSRKLKPQTVRATIETMPLKTKNGIIQVPKYSTSPEFKQLINKIKNVKTTGEQRVKDIANEILKFKGYPENSVNLSFGEIADTSTTNMGYNYIRNTIAMRSANHLDALSNEAIGTTLFHELTHMENAAKLIKSVGLRKFVRRKIMSNIRTQYNQPIKCTKESVAEVENKVISTIKSTKNNIEKLSKHANTTDKDSLKLLFNDIKNKYCNPTLRTDTLDRALNDYNYYNSLDEMTAYAAGNQFDLVANGTHFSKSSFLRTLNNQARTLAERKSKSLFGISNIEKLTPEQKLFLKLNLEEDFNAVDSMLQSACQKLNTSGNAQLGDQFRRLTISNGPYLTNHDIFLYFTKLYENNPNYINSFLDAVEKLP